MGNTVNNFTLGKFQHEVARDKVRSSSAWVLIISAGVIFMLALLASALDDPLIYNLVILLLLFGVGTLAVNFINSLLDLKDRLKKKDNNPTI